MRLDEDEERRREAALYWLKFIKSQLSSAPTSSEQMPTVFIAGSNRDAATDPRAASKASGKWASKWGQSFVSQMRNMFVGWLAVHEHFFVLHCAKPTCADMNLLRTTLAANYKWQVAR